jgi:hypothetical protein
MHRYLVVYCCSLLALDVCGVLSTYYVKMLLSMVNALYI